MSIARISDIKGLVTLGESGEEILKNRDLISEHGGILTIEEFAKIIFNDGREVEVTGPVSFNLDSSFFNETTFEESITQISDFASLDYLNSITDDTIIEEEQFNNTVEQTQTTQTIETEQLETTLNQDNRDSNLLSTQENEQLDTTTDSQTDDSNPINNDPAEIEEENELPRVDVKIESLLENAIVKGQISFSDSEGPATLSLITEIPNGMIINSDGTYSFDTNAYDYLSDGETETIVISFKVTDSDGASVDSTITFNVLGTNDAPTLSVESTKSVDEDGNTSITYAAADIDGTVNVVASAENGTVTVNSDGTITYTPDANFNGTDTITVTATDDDGASVIQTSTITVNDVNDAPTLSVESTKSVDEDGNTSITYAAADIDGTVNVVASAENGTVTVNSDGTITYTPDANFNGTDTITVTATDDDGASVIQTSTITVNDVNDAPTLSVESTKSVDEDGNTSITYAAADIDGTVNVVASAENGTVTVNSDGTITYTPDANFNGTDTITVTATDDDGASVIQTSTITVNDVNDAPTLSVESTKSVDEDGNTSITYAAADIDGTVNVVASAENGTVTVNSDGTITYTPDANFNGTDTITVTATDDDGASVIQTSTITVNDVNDAPTLSVESTKSVDEDGNTSITYAAADIDGTVNVVASAENGTVTVNSDGTITYTPDANFNGTDTITVTATDDDGASVIQTSTITVNDVNDAPTLSVESTKSVDEDGNTSITYAAADIDGTVNVVASAENGTVTVNSDGTITYTPDANFNGTDTITVTATDDDGASVIQTSTITVNDVNDAPTLSVESTKSVDEDGNTSITYAAADIDGTVNVVASAENGTVTVNSDGTITYTPDANFNGTDTITVTATDDDGASVIQTSTITVNDVNDAPTLSVESTKSVDEDGNTSITYAAADIDGTVNVVASAENGTVTVNSDGTITYTPDANFNGTDTITVTATDDDGASVIQTSTITVNDVNDGPIAVDDSSTGETISIDNVNNGVAALDGATGTGYIMYSSDNLHDRFSGSPIHGSNADNFIAVKNINGDWFYDTNNGYVEFTPTKNDRLVAEVDFGSDTISLLSGVSDSSYQINGLNAGYLDGDLAITANRWGSSNNAGEFGISGTSINIAGNSTDEDTALIITADSLLTNDTDADGDTLSITAVQTTGDTHGTVSLDADGNVVFTPEANYNGEASFTYTVSDGQGGTDTATVTLNVSSVNDLPEIDIASTATVNEDGTLTIGADSFSVTDIEDGTITPTFSASNGTVTLDSDGNIIYTPNENYNGTDTITVTATDSNGGVTTEDITVTVNAVNDGPVAEDDLGSSSVTINVLGTDGALVFDSTGSNPELLGGATSVDISMTITGEANQGQVSLVSYASSGHNNEFLIFSNGNNVYLYIDGANVKTDVKADDIFDGTEHTLSVSWDSSNGEANISVDGSLIDTVTIEAGHTIDSNGVLMFGQEQDSVGGGLSASQIFEGTYHDISISTNGTEVAHWNMSNISNGEIVDSVGDFDLQLVGDAVASGESQSVNEDSSISLDVLLNDTDIDGDILSVSEIQGQDVSAGQTVNVTNPSGDVLGTAEAVNGKIVFCPNGTLQSLNDGEKQDVTFEYTVSDDNGVTDTANIILNVVGTNDAPVINSVSSVDVSEDSTVINGSITSSDLDNNSTATYTAPAISGFILNDDGTYSFDPSDAAYQNLNEGDTITVTVPVTVTDDNGATDTTNVVFNLTGTNDIASVSVSSGSVTEDDASILSTSGVITVTDVDAGEAQVQPQIETVGTYGAFSIDEDGNWIYEADNSQDVIQNLSLGESLTETFSVTSEDGTSSNQVTVTINGTNDGPIAVEDTTNGLVFDGSTGYVDAGDSLNDVFGDTNNEFNITAVINPDSLSNASTNHNVKNVFIAKASDPYNDNLEIGVNPDGTLQVYIDTKGADKQTSIGSPGDVVIGENNTIFVSYNDGVLTVNINGNEYVDNTTWASSNTNLDQANGSPFTIGASTHIDNYFSGTIDSVEVSSSGETKLSYDFKSSTPLIDKSGNEIDATIVGGVTPDEISTNEDTALTIDSSILLANDTDIDGDTLSIISVDATSNTHGTVSLDANGNVVFTPESNYNGEAVFTYTVSDDNGGTSTATVTVNV